MTETKKRGRADADQSIDELIQRRSEDTEELRRIEEAWAESARQFNLAAAAERRKEWHSFHNGMSTLHSKLAEEHRRKALWLLTDDLLGA